jgi:signal transduction histidine kinase
MSTGLVNRKSGGEFWSLFRLDGNHPQSSFLQFYIKQSISSIRLAFVLGFVLYGAFGFLDIYMAPETKLQIWVIRFMIVMPILVVAYAITYWKNFIKYSQIFLMILSLTVGFGVIAIIASTNETELAYRFYYSGILLCIIWSHSILRLKVELAILSTGLLIVGYNILAFFFQHLNSTNDLAILISNDCFLVGGFILGTLATNTTENIVLRDYRQGEIIKKEKEELAHSRHQLQELNAVKSKLISILSHDLRGPMASIRGILNLHKLGYITDQEFQQNAQLLSDSVDGASDLLENLLSWSIAEMSNRQMTKVNTDIYCIVSTVFALTRPQAERKKILLMNSIRPETRLIVEPTMIELVIRNLVTNAIKFTENGVIEVKAIHYEDHITILIEDTGSGIPDAVAANLFKWDKKNTTLGTQSEKGAGIGLLISKEFIEKHQGSLFFNTRVNEGTTFYFNLPTQDPNTNSNHIRLERQG